MASKSLKQSLKKNLAIATAAASLGVSLGVPVGDVLADDVRASSPPGYTLQSKGQAASVQPKVSNQLKESAAAKLQSDQQKNEATQREAGSSQSKVGYKVEPKPETTRK